ncbi:MAG TPA: MltA domain-containing protein [Dyella sp.]
MKTSHAFFSRCDIRLLRGALHRLLLLILAASWLAGCQTVPGKPSSEAKRATYTQVSWDKLPTSSDAEWLAGFTAWRAGCAKLGKDPVWSESCAAAADLPMTAANIRQFLSAHMDVFAVSTDKQADGLITGYYEPVYPGSRKRSASTDVPIYGVPSDLVRVELDSVFPDLKRKRLRGRIVHDADGHLVLKPYDDAASIADRGVDAPVLAWLKDPMDLQFLQIQGSGRVSMPDGQELRVGYADQNGYPYRPVGRWLIEQKALKAADVSMQSIRAWAVAHPDRVRELLASNPSYVFFKQKPASDAGPEGSLGVPLTGGYSVAIDPRAVPLGSLLWLATTLPNGEALARPVAAQDTGGAIVGNVRADMFFGTGHAAGELAGAMKQPGRLWLLWPKGKPLPQ